MCECQNKRKFTTVRNTQYVPLPPTRVVVALNSGWVPAVAKIGNERVIVSNPGGVQFVNRPTPAAPMEGGEVFQTDSRLKFRNAPPLALRQMPVNGGGGGGYPAANSTSYATIRPPVVGVGSPNSPQVGANSGDTGTRTASQTGGNSSQNSTGSAFFPSVNYIQPMERK